MDAPNEIQYSDNIYVSDWSLRVINGLLDTLIEEDEVNIIRRDVCEALDHNYLVDRRITIDQFRQFLWGRRLCGTVMCRVS